MGNRCDVLFADIVIEYAAEAAVRPIAPPEPSDVELLRFLLQRAGLSKAQAVAMYRGGQ